MFRSSGVDRNSIPLEIICFRSCISDSFCCNHNKTPCCLNGESLFRGGLLINSEPFSISCLVKNLPVLAKEN